MYVICYQCIIMSHISNILRNLNLFFRKNDEDDRKREACVFKNDDVRMLDDDLFALVYALPQALLDKVGLKNIIKQYIRT